MGKTNRKLVDLAQKIKGEQSDQMLLVAKVGSVSPFTLKMHDLTVTQHIYVNTSFTKTSSSEINSRVSWDKDQPYIPTDFLNFSKEMIQKDLLNAGDTVIVLLDGISFYVLERVVKVA